MMVGSGQLNTTQRERERDPEKKRYIMTKRKSKTEKVRNGMNEEKIEGLNSKFTEKIALLYS